MKILYGVVGEGMGHAIRSRVVIDHLLAEGHVVEVMASSRACDFLTQRYGSNEVSRIHGLHLIYEDNRVRKGRTLWTNVQAGAAGIPRNISAYFDLLDRFEPEVVISDFESWTYLFGLTHRLPVISIDNMQIISRCQLPKDIVQGHAEEFRLTKTFVKGKLPFCSHYLITTFFTPDLRKSKTTLVPPILRPEVLAATPSEGEHLLVYQTAEGESALLPTLRASGVPCKVYGMRRSLVKEEVEGNLRFQPFSEERFIADLAGSRGVIAGGGFTLMGETVYLKKPMLSYPLSNQFEQVLNAKYLERVGYGLAGTSVEDPSQVERFLRELPSFAERLSGYHQDGNTETLATLDALLDKAAAGLL